MTHRRPVARREGLEFFKQNKPQTLLFLFSAEDAAQRPERYSDESGERAHEGLLRAAWRAMDGAP